MFPNFYHDKVKKTEPERNELNYDKIVKTERIPRFSYARRIIFQPRERKKKKKGLRTTDITSKREDRGRWKNIGRSEFKALEAAWVRRLAAALC